MNIFLYTGSTRTVPNHVINFFPAPESSASVRTGVSPETVDERFDDRAECMNQSGYGFRRRYSPGGRTAIKL